MLNHHPSDETLMSFASGALDEAFAMVVTCHLQFCAMCRARTRQLEEIGSVLFEDLEVSHDDGFERRVMSAFRNAFLGDRSASLKILPAPGDHRIMPAPLAAKTGLTRETIPWKQVSTGVSSAVVAPSPGATSALHFLTLAPGMRIEPERHQGGHFIVVLWGAYESELGLVNRGDFHEIDPDTDHYFRAASEEGVVCVVATDSQSLSSHSWAST